MSLNCNWSRGFTIYWYWNKSHTICVQYCKICIYIKLFYNSGDMTMPIAPCNIFPEGYIPGCLCSFPKTSMWRLQWRCQNFAPGGGTGTFHTGSEVCGDKVIQKWKPSGVRTAKFARIRNSRGAYSQCPMPGHLSKFVGNLLHDPSSMTDVTE